MITPRSRRRKSQCILAPSPQQGPRNQVITLANIHTYTRLITHPNQNPHTLPNGTPPTIPREITTDNQNTTTHHRLCTRKRRCSIEPSPDQVPAESGTQHPSTKQSICWSLCPIQTHNGCPTIVAVDRCARGRANQIIPDSCRGNSFSFCWNH